MRVSALTREDLSEDIIDRLLFAGLQDSGENADCVIVLGSMKASLYRVPVAARLYHCHRADKLLLCGGKVRDFPEGPMSESQHMRICAENLGVKSADILVDENSMNTLENILEAMVVLQRSFGPDRIHSVLLVTTSYHMRRSLCIARHLFPRHIQIIPCPADDTHTRRDNWMKNAEGRNRAVKEAEKIIGSVKDGLFPDFEV